MSKKTTLWVMIGLLLAVSIGLALMVSRDNSAGSVVPSPMLGKEAPVFSLPLLDAPAQTLGNAQLAQHKVVVLNVWASWCVPCRAEMAVLQQLQQAMPSVPIYGLLYKDTPQNAQQFLQQAGNPFAATAVDADGRVGIDWGVYGVPETYVLQTRANAQGAPTVYIIDKHIGGVTPADVEHKFLPLLQKLSNGDAVVAP